jgi:hypothetical protein
MKQLKPSLIGLIQAVGVIVYCVLVAMLINFMGKNAEPVGFWGVAAMLILLVFSAGVTGSMVFGYPAYLLFKEKEIKRPLLILASTSFFCLIILAVSAIVYLISLGF